MRFFQSSFLLIANLLIFGFVAKAQQAPKVQMPASPTPDITVTPFDAARFPSFGNVFTADKAGLEAESFVLTNNSDKPIAGIDVEWVITDNDGRRRPLNFESDRFQSPMARAIAEGHDVLLVAPGTFLSESTQKWIDSGASHGGVSASVTSGGGTEFSDAAQISVSIDCVIFGDGEVVGPNLMRFTDEIQARPVAANTVVEKVQSALNAGQDPSTVLSPLVNTPLHRNDFVGQWEARFAQQLLHSPNIEVVLAGLERFPPAPKLYRLDGGPV